MNTRILKKCLRRLGLSLGLLLILVAILYGLLHTPWGYEHLARALSGAVSARIEGRLELEDLSGLFPFRVKVGRLALSDPPETPWLIVQDASAVIDPRPFWNGRIRVNRLTADQVRFRRRPATDAPKKAFSWETIPPLCITTVRVDAVHLESVAGLPPLTFSVDATMEHRDGSGGSRMDLTLAHPHVRVEAAGGRNAVDAPWTTRVSVQVEPGSPLHDRWRLPAHSSWALQATSEGRGGEVVLTSASMGSLTTGVQVDRNADGLRVHLTPDLTLTPERVPTWVAPVTGYRFLGTGTMLRTDDRGWSVDGAGLRMGDHVAEFEISLPDEQGAWWVGFDASLAEVAHRDVRVGATRLHGRIEGGERFRVKVAAAPRGLDGLQPDLLAWLGPAPEIRAELELSPSHVVVRQLHLAGALGSAEIDGAIDVAKRDIDLAWRLQLGDLQHLPSLHFLSGLGGIQPVTAAGEIRGAGQPVTSFSVTARIAAIESTGGTDEFVGSVDGAGLRMGDHVAELEISLPDEQGAWWVGFDAALAEVAHRDVRVGATQLRGRVEGGERLRVNLAATPRGLEGLQPDLLAWLGPAPEIRAELELSPSQVAVRQLHLDGALGGVEIDGAMDVSSRDIDLSWRVQVTDPQSLPSLHAFSSLGVIQPVTATGEIRGTGQPDTSFAVTARVAAIQSTRITIDPMEARYANGCGTLFETQLRAGPAVLRIAGEADAEGLRARVSLDELALEDVPDQEGVAGQVTGHAEVRGSWQQPEVEATLGLSGVQSTLPDAGGIQPVHGQVSLTISNQVLHASAHLQTQGQDRLDLETHLPVHLKLVPWTARLGEGTDGTLTVRGRLDLDAVNAMPVMAEQRLSGILELDVQATGSPRAPRFTGTARVREGRYEHFLMGTELRDLDVQLDAEDQTLSIRSLSARDPTGGTLAGSGHVLLQPHERFPFQVDLRLVNTQLLANDLLTAGADGTLQLAGTLEGMKASGALTLSPVQIQIPNYLPLATPGYRVIDPLRVERPVRVRPSAPSGSPIELAVQIDVPARMSVKGRGLESTWGGQVKVGGTAGQPRIVGALHSQRGRFNFFGQPFTIQESAVRFTGDWPPHPTLDIIFERKRPAQTAYLKMEGSTTDPVISLSSEPPLPTEEVLPQVLFGKDIRDISPLQAIRVAQAARALQGGGSALDFMGHAQRLLSVDQLNIEQADDPEGLAKVTAGKYISDRVYIEGQDQGGAGNGRLSLEVELTPRISLETDIQSEMKRGVGLKFKRHF